LLRLPGSEQEVCAEGREAWEDVIKKQISWFVIFDRSHDQKVLGKTAFVLYYKNNLDGLF
jgi:hypothetical protein